MSALAFQGIGVRSNLTVRKRIHKTTVNHFPAVKELKIPFISSYIHEKKSSLGWAFLILLFSVTALFHIAVATSLLTKHDSAEIPEVTLPQALPMVVQFSRPRPVPAVPEEVKPKPAVVPQKAPVKKSVTADKPVETTTQAATDSVAVSEPVPQQVSAPVRERVKEEEVVGPRSDAGYLNNPAPAYPQLAISRKWEGQVLLNVRVFSNGSVDSIEVARTSGRKVLDDAAVKTVQTWRFVPAKRGKDAIDGWVQVPIDFKLG